MLYNKIEEAFVHKYIAKLVLSENDSPVYGVFTGRIKVLNHVEDSNVTSTYKYYFKEIDINEYAEKKDVYKAMKSVITIMQDQIADVEESISVGFSNRKYIM